MTHARIERPTLVEMAFGAFERHGHEDQYLTKQDGRWRPVSSERAANRIERLAGALRGLGVGAGDRVALMAPTRLEWVLTDLATLMNGAVLVPLYPTLSSPQVGAILQDSGAQWAVVSGREELDRVRESGVKLGHIVTIDPVPGEISLQELEDRGGPRPTSPPSADDLATLIYTSGTTAEPKGVMLSHANISSNVLQASEALGFKYGMALSFLPLSHVFERQASYFFVHAGLRIAFAESLDKLGDNMREVRPRGMTVVPRVLEKVSAGLRAKLETRPGPVRKLATWAMDGACQAAHAKLTGGRPSSGQALRHALAERLVFRKLRQNMGGNLDFVVSGGAATPEPLAVLFEAAGVRVLPGYGLTESSPVIAVNTSNHRRLGSVGRPLPGLEVRTAGDGEILVRGSSVMRGYWNREQATREVLLADGWLRTGDVGHVDADGFLFVTDRKKEILVTSGGKNIAPQAVEAALVSDPLIEQAMLVGDGRPFVSALVVPAMPALESWARSRGLDASDPARLLGSEAVQELYRSCIDRRTSQLARFETIKRFALLERELTQEAGELTPTLKLKRRVVLERFRDRVEALYATDGPVSSCL